MKTAKSQRSSPTPDAATDIAPAIAYAEALREMKRSAPDVEKARVLLERAHAAGDKRATYALATWYLHGNPPAIRRSRAKALKFLEAAAEAGIPNALYDLAVFYEKGENGQPDFCRAFILYLRAALSGNGDSVYEVGRCYYYGIGIQKDRRLATVWLDRAAKIGVGLSPLSPS